MAGSTFWVGLKLLVMLCRADESRIAKLFCMHQLACLHAATVAESVKDTQIFHAGISRASQPVLPCRKARLCGAGNASAGIARHVYAL